MRCKGKRLLTRGPTIRILGWYRERAVDCEYKGCWGFGMRDDTKAKHAITIVSTPSAMSLVASQT